MTAESNKSRILYYVKRNLAANEAHWDCCRNMGVIFFVV